METISFSAVSSRNLSPSAPAPAPAPSLPPRFFLRISGIAGRPRLPANSASSWTGSTLSLVSSPRNPFTREVWGWVNSNSRNVCRESSFIVRAEMFGQLTSGLESAWNKLRGVDVLTKENIAEPMRDIRRALLEADVSLPVVRRFVQSVSEQAAGVGLIRGVQPDQQLVKVVVLVLGIICPWPIVNGHGTLLIDSVWVGLGINLSYVQDKPI